METKKSPSKDIHKWRGVFFAIGLATSLAIVITAFQWRSEFIVAVPTTHDNWDEPQALIDMPITEIKPTQPIAVHSSLTKTSSSAPEFVETAEEPSEIDISSLFPSDTDPIGTVSSIPLEPEPNEEPIVVFAEFQPEPVGGLEAFYQEISKKLRYPRAAEQNQVGGKVFVSFVVEKDGTLSHLKIAKGIGYGCDEAALKSIPNIPWTPGKQRGKAVRVQMMLPITFAFR